jgi:hypothetical protein
VGLALPVTVIFVVPKITGVAPEPVAESTIAVIVELGAAVIVDLLFAGDEFVTVNFTSLMEALTSVIPAVAVVTLSLPPEKIVKFRFNCDYE